MKKKFTNVLVVLTLLLNVSLTAQTIGGYSLVNAAAPILTRSIGAGGLSAGFLEAVGGVAFEKKAMPAQGFEPHSILLHYVPESIDGTRLEAVIDGQTVRVNLYDWQLAPLVKFASSDDHAVFTLFGHLNDRKQEQEILKTGGRVVNYHQAFTNSLMGLRMLQLDNLLASSDNNDLAVEMPKNGNRYILGAGEHLPNVPANRAAITRFQAALRAAGIVQFGRSYVVGDSDSEIRFGVDEGRLQISGQPSYYFWEYNGDRAARSWVRQGKAAAQKAQGSEFDEQQWLIGQIEATRQRLGQPLTEFGRLVLSLRDTDELQESLEETRAAELEKQPEYKKIVHLAQLSQFVNSRISMVRSINPAVWDVAVTTMQYSAFFRYCRQADPAGWEGFANSVRSIAVRPAVSTPTVLRLTEDLSETSSRSPAGR
jgi:hypothetical protein